MNRFISFRNLLILILLIITVIWGSIAGNNGWNEAGNVIGQRLMPPFKANEVDRIVFTDIEGNVELRRNTTDGWETPTKQNFPVPSQKVSSFLYRLEILRAAQVIPGYKESDASRYALNNPVTDKKGTGLLIRIYRGNDLLGSLTAGQMIQKENYVGDRILPAAPSGRYYKTDLQGAVAAVEPFGFLQSGAAYWLQRQCISVEYILKMSMTSLQDQKIIWAVARPNLQSQFAFTDSIQGTADHTRILGHAQLWNTPNFLDAVPVSEPPPPAYEMRVVTADGFIYRIFFAEKRAGEDALCCYYFKLERDPQQTQKDQTFDKNGRQVNFPRDENELNSKFNSEKLFEKWAYIIPAETYIFMTAPRTYLEKGTRIPRSGTGMQSARQTRPEPR